MTSTPFALRPGTPTAELIAACRAEALATLEAERAAAPVIGTSVTIPSLSLTAVLLSIQPPRVEGGEALYRVEWHEAHSSTPRQANFWLSDFDAETQARLGAETLTVANGVAA